MSPLLILLCLGLVEGISKVNKTGRYVFWRNMDRNLTNMRRVFGGTPANLDAFPAVAALLDRYWNIRCSGSIIAEYWALTAAHCVTSRLTYVLYNARRPFVTEGDYTPILYLYRHPNYEVLQEDEGRGMDVTLLHHDLGLIRTRNAMKLRTPLTKPIEAMRQHTSADLMKKVITVVGFGRTELPLRNNGEELFSVKLQMIDCNKGAWFHCICGVGTKESFRGVCSGDSGGPVVYQGVQVGVTSMGPIECAERSDLDEGATSVFTSLNQYVDLINATILDTEKTIAKQKPLRKGSDFSHTHRLVTSKMTVIFLTIITFLRKFSVNSIFVKCF